MLFRVASVICAAALLAATALPEARAQFPGEQSKKAAAEAKKARPSAPPPVGEGCKTVPTIQAGEGDGCKTALMVLVQGEEVWGKGCSIGTNLWRFWCSNGRVYEETQPYPPPPGGVGQLCNPSQATKVVAAPGQALGQPTQAPGQAGPAPGKPAQVPGQAIRMDRQPVAATPDQSAITECLQQILVRNQCQAYLTVKDIRPVTTRGQTDDYVMFAEIEMESIQEFEVRSDIAQNCTGTWWKEDPKFTRYQFSFPEAKYFVKVGQLLSVKKMMSFKKNDFGWRCQVQSMKPVEEATVINRSQ
jgi:hypothetical protein